MNPIFNDWRTLVVTMNTVRNRVNKLTIAVAAVLLSGGQAIADNEPTQNQPVQEVALSTPADTQTEGGGRFVTMPGTSKSEVVSQSPIVPSSTPSPTTSNSIQELEKSIQEARAAGGIPMDPALRDIHLPGLKKDDPMLRPWVLHTRNGTNEIVKLSSSLINRIATPFKKPILIDASESVAKIVGSDIYYTPSGLQPIGLFVVDSDNKNQTISLTIIPTPDIPGQNLMIKMEDLRAAGDLAPQAGVPISGKVMQQKESDYQGMIRNIITQAVRGKVPGFSVVPLEVGTAMIGNIEVTPDIVFTGSSLDVYRYRLVNKDTKEVDLIETAFYRKGVKAVSFFPHISLDAGQEGYVFILADKPSMGEPS